MASSSYATGPTGPASGGCDEIGSCEGDGANPDTGCLECAVLGSQYDAVDGGACADEFAACFGDGGMDCTGAGDPECCQVYDCLEACDANMNNQIDAGPELDCFCTNDGSECVQNQLPDTCLGDYPSGIQTAVEWEACLFEDVCPDSCG
jgi:hypothetical protein